MFYSGARGGTLSLLLFVSALVLLGFLVSYPWWQYPKPLFVVLQILLVAACVILPFAFLMAWGARHAQARALEQAGAELGVWLEQGKTGNAQSSKAEPESKGHPGA